jgi:hypothetical protein
LFKIVFIFYAGFHNQWVHFVRYIGFVIAFAGVLVLVSVLARAVVSIFQGRNQVLKGWTWVGGGASRYKGRT